MLSVSHSLTARFAAAFLLTALADVFLFHGPPGLGLTLFGLCVAFLALRHHGRRLRRAGPWAALWVLLLLSTAVESSLLAKVLLLTLGWTVLALGRREGKRELFAALLGGTRGGLRSFADAPRDARRLASTERGRRTPGWVYAWPVALTLLFAWLLVPANPVMGRWLGTVGHVISGLDAGRALFWALVFGGVYGVTRFRPGRKPVTRATPYRRLDPHHELKTCRLAFLLLNVLFLSAVLADGLYLWMRFGLPESVTYSSFAHEGAYRLIVAIVLAGATVALFFRAGTPQQNDRTARRLAYLFVAQNLIVLAGAARRLQLYADAYGLTRFRVAAIFWLVLVAAGLALLLIKIRGKRPFAFLLDGCTAAALLVLSAWALGNIDGWIANWNVHRYLDRGERRVRVDVLYLGGLGPGALPALHRLGHEADPIVANQAATVLERRLLEERLLLASFSTWTYRRYASVRAVEAAH